MDISMEIRKLPFSSILELSRILEPGESWKTLMGLIPKQLFCDNYNCDLEVNNLPKYRSEHFRLIEDSSIKYKKSCTEILLDEWGTSGRVRPALGHLKYLLEKAELFRAADYVTVDLLKQPPPQRPHKGPAAAVNLSLDASKDNIEEILDKMKYPSAINESIFQTSINTNINHSTKRKPSLIPKIVINESPDTEESSSVFNMPLVVMEKNLTLSESSTESDMMKFSNDSVQESKSQENVYNLPNSSILNNRTESILKEQNHNIPVSILEFGSGNSQMSTEASENFQQSLSNALELSNANVQNNLLFKPESKTNIESANMSAEEIDGMIPAISDLLGNSHNSNTSNDISAFTADNNLSDETNNSQGTAKTSRSCASPLPNLSLNTLLPHFSYSELEVATNNFDETSQTQGGRFLGSGAFGKVYLALELLGKPVAVKKLLLDNVDVVHINDTVTKQFRNEVEVLSKYKHENLLSLLGYSCDGCTYCLMYEYMPGGALKDRLHNPEKLIWTERLYIAIGTAKAISYLHTAFSTPLIHRDVKTANILLDSNNKPKLCDFGLIKLTPNQNTYINTTAYGTSAYMAPEAFRGDISVKLDTFSFGVVLLELLTALPPYDDNRPGRDLVTHLQEVCEDDIQPFLDNSAGSWTSNNVNFADDLFNIANQCLNGKKAKRPNMVEVTTALSNLLKKAL